MKTKFLIIAVLIFTAFTTSSGKLDDAYKGIMGEWCSSGTYKTEGIIKGFNLMKGGKCKALNVPSLDLQSWEIVDGHLITKGFYTGEDGVKEEYDNKEKISKLTKDSLILVYSDPNGAKFTFLYLRPAYAKKCYSNLKK